jgi:hypothetical protein
MRLPTIAILALSATLTGASSCSSGLTADLTAHPVLGQLFCQLDTAEGSTVVGLIDGTASASTGAVGGAVAVLATGAAQADVQSDCQAAAANEGAKAGVPVSPPATAVGNVAVVPVGTTAKTGS